MLNISTHSYGASLGRKQNFVLMFKVNFLGLGLLSFFFLLHTHTHTHNLKHNAYLTHVTSFRLMTPRPVGLRALGVETPLRAL
jgi:hypothetical protein